jgi:WD40 repeat protein
MDRSIKVWNINADHTTNYVQSLFGHSSTVTRLVDGNDGSLLSCSEDGSLRVWCPQRGRTIMLHPFFECTYMLSFGTEVWMDAALLCEYER